MVIVVPELTGYATVRHIAVSLPYVAELVDDGKKCTRPDDVKRSEAGIERRCERAPRGPTFKEQCVQVERQAGLLVDELDAPIKDRRCSSGPHWDMIIEIRRAAPYAHPEKAARRIVEIASTVEAVQDGRTPYRANQRTVSVRNKRSPAEYGAGMKLALERGWRVMHESGTLVRFTPCRTVRLDWPTRSARPLWVIGRPSRPVRTRLLYPRKRTIPDL